LNFLKKIIFKNTDAGRWTFRKKSRPAESFPQEIVFQFTYIIPLSAPSPLQSGNEGSKKVKKRHCWVISEGRWVSTGKEI
jgi:hypothetical protein